MNHPLDRILDERKMTDAEMDKREKIVKTLKKKKGEFESRYGKDAKEVMYATATKMAMGEDIDEKTKTMGDLHRIEKTREGYQLFVYSPYSGKFIAQGPPHKSKKDAEKDAMAYEDLQLDEKFVIGRVARVGFINRKSKDVVRDLRDAKKKDLFVSAQEAPGSRTTFFDITFASEGQFKEFMDSYDVMLVDMIGEAFKPHKMYNPETGEEVDANTKADHLKYKAMGYTHDKPKDKIVEKTVAGTKKKDEPFTVVAIKDNKVVDQFGGAEHHELSDVIEYIKKKNPGAVISVEKKRGGVVHVEEDVQLDEEARGQHGNIQMDNIGDPENPNVIVSGYGVLSVNFLKKDISKRLKELATRLERGDSDFLIRELTPGKGILKLFVDALEDVETQMNSPKVKRKLTMLKKKG